MVDDRLDLRCSDADRERVAARLREHYAQGRLTLQEFDERTSAAYAAKTFGDLAPLTADLPAETEPATPAPERGADAAKARRRMLAMWTPWLTVNAICTLVWLLSDPGGYFWPIWVMGPWGVILLIGTLTGTHPQRRGHAGQPQETERRLEDRRAEVDEHRRARLEHRLDRLDHRRDRLDHRRDRLDHRRGRSAGPSGELD